ncbi:class I SAM-dependent methyltransferase [Iamia sp.]|uniref:class I SAM-dependent methyltransferase n=1 Tax=Iamia sp. TaxID=2722710 RepID=UPI002C2A2981|nr:class I SAM-dependent methyltransferase [Iamia sp.]HXH56824.1 class I SAM-dependent methyltransferase [Iamia sp.]
MLTVDYERLKLEPGHLVLDMGAGAGRHAYEAFRRGARVVALDHGFDELTKVTSLFAAMCASGEAGTRTGAMGCAVNGDGTRLPFPDDTFDRIICSEVLEHIPDDEAALAELRRVLKSGGTIAATVPSAMPERLCWRLSEEYHAPFVAGGHVRILTEAELRRKMRAAGLQPGDSHHAHALHSPYWWLRCAVGPTNDEHPLVRAYHRLLVWDITKAPRLTRWSERLLNPVLGKSLVVYARAHPARRRDAPAAATATVAATPAAPHGERPPVRDELLA